MSEFDLTIRNGTIVNAADTTRGDIGVRAGKIVAIADKLPAGARDLDATGRHVLPGGIDSHCHVAQLSASGMMTADDFYAATVSAAFGGTTTIIPFAAQHRGMSLPKVVADYHACAGPKAVIDYGFHLIVFDPTEQALKVDLPELLNNARQAQALTYNATPVVMAALMYLLLLWPIMRLLSRLDHKSIALH